MWLEATVAVRLITVALGEEIDEDPQATRQATRRRPH